MPVKTRSAAVRARVASAVARKKKKGGVPVREGLCPSLKRLPSPFNKGRGIKGEVENGVLPHPSPLSL